jgi:hypothetical protein
LRIVEVDILEDRRSAIVLDGDPGFDHRTIG